MYVCTYHVSLTPPGLHAPSGSSHTRGPPKDKVQATTVSMAALFAGHQIGTKNGPYYGENIDTPAKL